MVGGKQFGTTVTNTPGETMSAFTGSFSLREKQKQAVSRLLNLNKSSVGRSDSGSARQFNYNWKVLIYDEHCSDILSPLLNVQELRELGVTLHMQISSSRENIEDVPAIYFVRPTQASIDYLSEDLAKQLYDSYHLNFSCPMDRKLLELLATKYADSCGNTTANLRLYDQFLDFVSVEEDFFSLNLQNSFQQFFAQNANEQVIGQAVARVVDGLFAALVTLGVIPTIQCPAGGAAEMVCQQLSNKIYRTLSNSKSSHLFSGDKDPGSSSATPKRPVLVLFDRNIDIVQALHHTSTYQALTDDLFETKLNRVKIVDSETGAVSNVSLDGRIDKFWDVQCGELFPNVVEAAEQERKRLIGLEQEIKRKAQDSQSDMGGTSNLHDAVSNLEKYEEDKKRINSHYKVLEAIMEKVADRNIPSFFETEQQIAMSDTIQTDAIVKMLSAEGKGSVSDKLRLFIIWYLCTDDIADGDFANAKYTLQRSFEGGNAAGNSLQGLSMNNICEAIARMKLVCKPYEKSASKLSNDTQQDSQLASAAAWATSMLKEGTKLVKKWIPRSNVDTKITRICSEIMKNTGDNTALGKEGIKDMVHFDPMMKASKLARNPLNSENEVEDLLVFLIGGATYTEYHNLKAHARNMSPPRNVIFGSTEIVNGERFLKQVNSS